MKEIINFVDGQLEQVILIILQTYIDCHIIIQMSTNMTKTYLFFESKSKKPKKAGQMMSNHSRSLSAKSDLTKNSARNKLNNSKPQGLPLTKKEKQIRQAIEYRYKKSKMREFVLQYKGSKTRENLSRSCSSQMEEFRQMKNLKVVNLKQYHEKAAKHKLQQKQKNSVRSRLKIRTDSSLVIKTEGSQKSIQKIKFLKSYLQPHLTPTKLQSKLKQNMGSRIGNITNQVHETQSTTKQDWKFISIQCKDKEKQKFSKQGKSRHKQKDMKIHSHRTLTVETNQKPEKNEKYEKGRMKTTQSQWDIVPKLKDLGKLNKKYKF